MKQRINASFLTTKNAFSKQKFDANLDRFINDLDSIASNLERQAMFIFYSIQ